MKEIRFAPSFKTQFNFCKKHYPNFVKDYRHALELFTLDKSSVRDHQLIKKHLVNYRAFSITEDIRIIYRETTKSYIFLFVGSHKDIY